MKNIGKNLGTQSYCFRGSETNAEVIDCLHLKDFVFACSGKPEDIVVGTGNIDLGRIIKVCRKARNLCIAVLEYESDVNNPVQAMKKCVRAFRKAVVK